MSRNIYLNKRNKSECPLAGNKPVGFTRMFKELNEGLQLLAVEIELGATELKASVLNHYNASRPVSI